LDVKTDGKNVSIYSIAKNNDYSHMNSSASVNNTSINNTVSKSNQKNILSLDFFASRAKNIDTDSKIGHFTNLTMIIKPDNEGVLVRAKPNLNGILLGRIRKNTQIEVYKEMENGYYKLTNDLSNQTLK
jgi:alpha-glucuronidase